MFKILFQPGGFYRLFGTPMTLFVGNVEDGVAVLGNDFKEVQERIEDAVDFKTMIGLWGLPWIAMGVAAWQRSKEGD